MRVLPFLFLAATFACAESDAPPARSSHADNAAPAASPVALESDPGAAGGELAVAIARDQAPVDEVVVSGRVSELVPDAGAFVLVDAAIDYCGSGGDPMDDCDTPWDYCCVDRDRLRAHSLFVELRDASGAPLTASAMPDLRLLDLAVARGDLVRDEHGNAKLVATGVFRRDRPHLRDGLSWPE